MTDKPKTLAEWRLAWTPQQIVWRTGWQSQIDDARQERVRARAERRRRDRKTFGANLWGAFEPTRNAESRTSHHDLPVLDSEAELALWLNISLPRLRWFTHDRTVDFVWHYVRYTIPKRRGGQRMILAPKRELKAIQRKILSEILAKLRVDSAAHGFVPGRSVISNAAPHVGKKFVLNMDLRDFFPSITFRQVRHVFIGVGYSFSVASVLALLCTERDRVVLERNGAHVYVAVGERTLIQGAPTSPALSNLVARRFDLRLSSLAGAMNADYTRYADDLTFSGDDYQMIYAVQKTAARILTDEKFTVHHEKTHLHRQSNRQIVTGLVVNEKVSVPRDMRRTLRAILHNAQKGGLAAQNRNNTPDFRAYLTGWIGYVGQTDGALAEKLSALLREVND